MKEISIYVYQHRYVHESTIDHTESIIDYVLCVYKLYVHVHMYVCMYACMYIICMCVCVCIVMLRWRSGD